MAGEWIPMQVDLADKVEVLQMAKTLRTSPDAIVGKLLRLWAWFRRRSTHGTVPLTAEAIEKVVGLPQGFVSVMTSVGWLLCIHGGGSYICIPNPEKWSAQAVSRRLLAHERQRRRRMNGH